MNSGWLKGISLFILGLLIGASLTILLIGYQLDNLTLSNRALQSELTENQQKLQQLKEASEAKKNQTIRSVEAFLIMEPLDSLTDYDKMSIEVEANKRVKEWLSPIVGQEVPNLDSLLIPRIVDNREIEANGNKYRLRTYLVVINTKTTVYIKASIIKPPDLIH